MRIALMVFLVMLMSYQGFAILFSSDFFDLVPLLIEALLLYFLRTKSQYTDLTLELWAYVIMIFNYGLKTAAKSIVIMNGNGWEVNRLRYGIDVGAFVIGVLLVLYIGNRRKRGAEE